MKPSKINANTHGELSEYEERARFIIDFAADSIVSINHNHLIIAFNSAAEATFGYSQEEVLGQPLDLLLPKEVIKKHQQLIRGFSESPFVGKWMGSRRELFGRRKTGELFPAEISISKQETIKGQVYTAILRDVTERMQIERALKESEERFKAFAESASDWFWEMDADFRYTFFSERYQELTGIDPRKRYGMRRWDNLPPSESEGKKMKWDAHKADLLAHRPFRDFQYNTIATENVFRYLNVSGKPIFDVDGEFKGYRGVSNDITVQKQAEKVQRDLNHKYRELFENANDAIFVNDPFTGKILDVNKRTVENLGYSRNELRQMKISDINSQFSEIEYSEWAKKVYKLGHTITETEHTCKDGSVIPVEVSSRIINYGDQNVVQSFVRDISERKQHEDTLRQAQKMEAVGQLTGGVAHDFNNLLAIIMGNADMLKDLLEGDDDTMECIEAINAAVDRGASLTGRLLAFSRQQALSSRPTAINALVLGLEDMLQRTLGETIEFRMRLGSGACNALIDPHQFENALVNLAINARDAMPSGGALTIETADVSLDETYAGQYEDVIPGNYVRVAVSDNGTGIAAEVLEKVFEPFFTTKDVGKGSGLGLSMVYGFAKQSGGHIAIYSEVNHGTTVKLYMPQSLEAGTDDVATDTPPRLERGSERILVVEDDADVRKISVTILRNQGYEIVEAINGNEAVELLKDGQPFDLLFTDVVLPGGMNGVEIAEEAQRLQPGIKVIYTTGYAENAVVHQGRLDPGVTLVNKPYRRNELLNKVRTVLDSEGD